jgi:hypothetical protein
MRVCGLIVKLFVRHYTRPFHYPECQAAEANPASYFRYYHECRTHLGLDKQCPIPRQVTKVGRIIAIPQLGGLHHRYERVAA